MGEGIEGRRLERVEKRFVTQIMPRRCPPSPLSQPGFVLGDSSRRSRGLRQQWQVRLHLRGEERKTVQNHTESKTNNKDGVNGEWAEERPLVSVSAERPCLE